MKKYPGKKVRSDGQFDFDFIQPYQRRAGGALKSHHLRDGTASMNILVALMERGGHFGKVHRMGPANTEVLERYNALMKQSASDNKAVQIEDIAKYRPVDESFLTPGKRIVFNTRPALSDMQLEDKVQVHPTFTTLEEKIYRTCRPYLCICGRSRVRLAGGLAAELDVEYADRADIVFGSYREPWYTKLCIHDERGIRHDAGPERRTAMYLLNLERAPLMNDVHLTVLFGQGGTQTLLFSELLRGELSHLLDTPGFSMVEMVGPPLPKPAPPACDLLDTMLEWDYEVLLEGVVLDENGVAQPCRQQANRTVVRAKGVKRSRRAPRRAQVRADA